MAAKPKTEVKLRSANEGQIAGMIAKMFGVADSDHLTQVFDQIADVHGREFPELAQDFHLYPWECPVPDYVMGDKMNTMIEDLVGSDGTPYIARDSTASGKLSLWVVRAAFSDGMLVQSPIRGLVNHHLIGDEWLKVTAFQLATCLRKLRNNHNQ